MSLKGRFKAHWVAFFAVILIFVLAEAKGLGHAAPGDENVYYYMAKSIAEGQFPYKDFFYAHPPLHLIILSLLIKIFGVNFAVLKSATLLALLASSFFLYKTSLELFKNRLNDKSAYLISVLSVILFLFSFEVMFKATFSMGINFSIMFLMAGFYFVFTKRYFIGGIFAGFAGLTRLYTLAPVLAIFIFVFIKKIEERKLRDFLWMILGFFATFGIVIIALTSFFGHDFTDSAFKYHFLKPKLPNQRTAVYENVLKENWAIFSAFLLSLFIKNKKRFQLFYFAIFAHFLFLLSLNAPFEFYFIIGFPFMAVIGSYSIAELIRRINVRLVKYSIVFLISAVFLWNTAADAMFLGKIGFLEFSPLDKMAAKISSANPSQKIFGDDSVVPLLGLMANRSIALDYIDSNEKRLTSGLTNFYLFTNKLDDVDLSYIILRKNKGLHQIAEFRQYVQDRCPLEKEYSGIAEGTFLLYRCS